MKRRRRVHELNVDIPEEWSTAAPVVVSLLGREKVGRRGLAVLVIVMLGDGTNIVALTWPRGQALARVAQSTGWSVEERFDGKQAPGEAGPVVQWLWRAAVESLVAAVRAAEGEFGGRP